MNARERVAAEHARARAAYLQGKADGIPERIAINARRQGLHLNPPAPTDFLTLLLGPRRHRRAAR